MNETTSEKLPAEKAAAGAPKKDPIQEHFAKLYNDTKLTRIPVAHLYFADTIDHSGGWQSQMSNAECWRPGEAPPNHNRYYVADFIPAWQVFEISAIGGPGATPKTEYLPAVHVRRWKRL